MPDRPPNLASVAIPSTNPNLLLPATVRTKLFGDPAPVGPRFETLNGGARKVVFASTATVNSNAVTPSGTTNAQPCVSLVALSAKVPAYLINGCSPVAIPGAG